MRWAPPLQGLALLSSPLSSPDARHCGLLSCPRAQARIALPWVAELPSPFRMPQTCCQPIGAFADLLSIILSHKIWLRVLHGTSHNL